MSTELEPTAMPSAAMETRLAGAGLPGLPRLAWMEVDTAVLAANARRLRTLLPPGTLMGVVVKADGYGHGLLAAALAAVRGGADMLLVATLDEALALRDAGVRSRILVLYSVPPAMLDAAVDADLDLVAADDGSVTALAAHVRGTADPAGSLARSGGPGPRIHLGVDTGMGRGGLAVDRVADAARALLDAGLDGLAGTWSHLATPEDPVATAAQVEHFEAALAALRGAGIEPGLRHLDATGGLLGGTAPSYDLVRIGLGFYGVVPPEVMLPAGHEEHVADLRPALAIRVRATTLSAIPAGASVGYGGTWTATRPSVIVTVALGYADGWARAYAAGSWGVVRGHRVPVIGRISSDALALDVTDVPGFDSWDEIVMLSGDGGAMTVHDLAELRGSISWEVLDAFTPRLGRVYMEGATPVGVRYLDGRTTFVEPGG